MKTIIELLSLEERKLTKTVSLKKDEILFHEDDICGYVGIVIEGNISISSYSYHGNEIVYNQLTNGSVFGNNLIFSTDPRYKGDVISKTKCKVVLINKNNLVKLLQSNAEFLNKYLEIQSEFSKQLNTKIKLLSFDSAEERFLYYLYINDNKIEYKTITNLANTLYMKRETLSRLISKLEKDGQVSKSKTIITLRR